MRSSVTASPQGSVRRCEAGKCSGRRADGRHRTWLRPTPNHPQASSAAPLRLAQVQSVVEQRCLTCHNAVVQSKGVALHTAALIAQQVLAIHQPTLVLKQLPMNNALQIIDNERALLCRWFEARATGG